MRKPKKLTGDNVSMKKKLSYSRFLVIFILVSIPLVFLSSLLNVMSYSNMITEVYTNANLTSTSGAIQRINYSMSFGKTIEKFYGLEDLLNETLNISEDILNVSVINSKNEIISQAGATDAKIPENIASVEYVSSRPGIFCSAPIDSEHRIVLRLSQNYVNKLTLDYVKSILLVSAVILLIVLLISFAIYYYISRNSITGGISTRAFKTLLMTSLVITQIALGGYVLSNYTNEYHDSLDKMAYIVSNVIDRDIESVVKQGIPFEEITGVEEYLQNIYGSIDEIVKIFVTDLQQGRGAIKNNFISNKIQILDQDYYINVEYKVNQELVNKNIINLLIEALILILVTILISIEISLFINRPQKRQDKEKIEPPKELNPSGLRIFFFVLFLALGLDSSFVSIVSYQLFNKLSDASNFLVSLPTTMGAIATIFGLLICLFVVNKIGMQKMIISGTALAAIGSISCGFCNDLFKFSLARGILGLGMAALISSTKLCAIFEKDATLRVKLLATVAAGRIAGYSCGVVIGGLISERSSYSFVFILEAVLIVASVLLISITNIKQSNNETGDNFSFYNLINIFKSSKVIVYMLLIIVPVYLASVFISYCVPLYGNEINLSQSIISGLMMINFMLSAYTSSISSKFMIKWFGVQKSTFLYVLFIILSIGMFSLYNTLATVIISVILLGFADGFGLNVILEEIYIIKPDIDKVTATFLFLLASKIGEAVAPILVSVNIESGISAASTSLIYVLAGSTGLYLIFLLVNNHMHTNMIKN